MRENKFQAKLVEEIKERYPGAIVLKNDAQLKRGIPDLTILYKKKWAVLECKKENKSSHRPGQDNYIEKLNEMSFARFIYPENKEEVLDEMDATFKPRRNSRISKCK